MLDLEKIADLLDAAPRYGAARDNRPAAIAGDAGQQGQTDRHVKLSDRMARDIAESLRQHARGGSPRALPLNRR